MKKRVNVIYIGNVQGVGFRYTTMTIAHKLGLKGWIKNLPDGGVELEAEGEEPELKRMLEDIHQQMSFSRFKEQISWMEASGEYEHFEIRYF